MLLTLNVDKHQDVVSHQQNQACIQLFLFELRGLIQKSLQIFLQLIPLKNRNSSKKISKLM